jgi:hypothetical protein
MPLSLLASLGVGLIYYIGALAGGLFLSQPAGIVILWPHS